jgi:hypothetical protein
MTRNLDFWLEYIAAASDVYLSCKPIEASADPMLAATIEWFQKIESAMHKATLEGRRNFSCRLVKSKRIIAFRFADADRSGFERTIRIDDRLLRTGEKGLTLGEIVDLKVCLQSLISQAPQRFCRLPLRVNGFIY